VASYIFQSNFKAISIVKANGTAIFVEEKYGTPATTTGSEVLFHVQSSLVMWCSLVRDGGSDVELEGEGYGQSGIVLSKMSLEVTPPIVATLGSDQF
jgi:hypothetical protein